MRGNKGMRRLSQPNRAMAQGNALLNKIMSTLLTNSKMCMIKCDRTSGDNLSLTHPCLSIYLLVLKNMKKLT